MARNVLITGASSGIGKACAYAFAQNGDALILCARRVAKLEEIKADIEAKYGVKVSTYELDVTKREEVAKVVDAIIKGVRQIDILVNNAGLALGLDKIQEYNIDDIETMIDTNVKGLLYVTRAVIPNMVQNDVGHIINMGSTAGLYAYKSGAVYCATKAAVRFLSDGIRIDTIDTNIKTTTIQPGIVETDFSAVRFHGDEDRAKGVYEGIEALKPEDIADVVVYTSNQPRRVQISDVTIMATNQATGFMVHKG